MLLDTLFEIPISTAQLPLPPLQIFFPPRQAAFHLLALLPALLKLSLRLGAPLEDLVLGLEETLLPDPLPFPGCILLDFTGLSVSLSQPPVHHASLEEIPPPDRGRHDHGQENLNNCG